MLHLPNTLRYIQIQIPSIAPLWTPHSQVDIEGRRFRMKLLQGNEAIPIGLPMQRITLRYIN